MYGAEVGSVPEMIGDQLKSCDAGFWNTSVCLYELYNMKNVHIRTQLFLENPARDQPCHSERLG